MTLETVKSAPMPPIPIAVCYDDYLYLCIPHEQQGNQRRTDFILYEKRWGTAMKKAYILLVSLLLVLAIAGCALITQSSTPATVVDEEEQEVKVSTPAEVAEEEVQEIESPMPVEDVDFIAADELASADERTDIQNLLGLDYDELIELFGEPTEEISEMHLTVYFDNGLTVGVGASVIIDFAQASNLQDFHFNGIDGTSAYDDVITLFGQPYSIREEHFGAVKSYAYEIQEASEHRPPHFVRFFFDIDDNIVAIQFFIPA